MAGERDFLVTAVATYRGETRDLGVWDTFEGGDVTAPNSKHRRGGHGQEISYGGPPSVDDITITRDYDLARDHALGKWLRARVGRIRLTIVKTPLDEFGQVFGNDPDVYTGRMIGHTTPNVDSNSEDIGFHGIILGANSDVG